MKKENCIYYLKHKRKHSLFLIINPDERLIRVVRTKTGFVSGYTKVYIGNLRKRFINSDKYKIVSRQYISQKLNSKRMLNVLNPVQLKIFQQIELF